MDIYEVVWRSLSTFKKLGRKLAIILRKTLISLNRICRNILSTFSKNLNTYSTEHVKHRVNVYTNHYLFSYLNIWTNIFTSIVEFIFETLEIHYRNVFFWYPRNKKWNEIMTTFPNNKSGVYLWFVTWFVLFC